MMRPIKLEEHKAALAMAVKVWRALIDANSPISAELERRIDLAERWQEFASGSEECSELYYYAEQFKDIASEDLIYDCELSSLIDKVVSETVEEAMLESTSEAVAALKADIIDGPHGRKKTSLDQLKRRVHELEAELWNLKYGERFAAMQREHAELEAALGAQTDEDVDAAQEA